MRSQTALLAMTTILLGAAAQADTLTLRNGQHVDGTFLGGSTLQVQFQDAKGDILVIPVGNVAGMTFTAPPPPPPPPKPSGRTIQVPAGTVIHVRIIDAINVDLSKPGQTYRASVDDPVMMGGNAVIPRGADVTLQAAAVKQAGKFKGSDEITL